ncbi:MAG: tRNA (adenosine(37)-N6)-threonylcarbamoyltransferase complex ATPase subunit type 1 TsaE [Deltaproteobacteria bacterium]|nr:MAG: tRNA (adenosine(37)-N6)-threonylcarbamoyltransferase complex ATPase subunit type 1 TsaE [Deltaproteobacteria bacterium]
MLEIVSDTPHETERIGSLAGEMLKNGDVVALSGELGTGKTTLIKGIAQGIGFDSGEVVSPSFTFINEYDGPLPLFHIDLYRLENEKELYEIGYEEYMQGDGVVVIEWADKVPHAVPEESLWITLRYLDAERREIIVTARGARYEKIIEHLRKKLYT